MKKVGKKCDFSVTFMSSVRHFEVSQVVQHVSNVTAIVCRCINTILVVTIVFFHAKALFCTKKVDISRIFEEIFTISSSINYMPVRDPKKRTIMFTYVGNICAELG